MEPHRPPGRSASHGALRSHSVRSVNHDRPLHKPLRSVNENSSLLTSPGALQSMLKTTTETGNIGLFSIKSVPDANLDLAYLGCDTVEYIKKSCASSRSTDDIKKRGNRAQLASHRDTTSEIISMYGSNSQSSVISISAPSTDETGQRSYSMTTVGSRQLSHNKSIRTLRSEANSGPLQRPRSPFPYPTRLKRPGARPVSPAVTDSGIVDYSRMVEIDRISMRTGHVPLKLSYPQPSRRLRPLGLRSDANLSVPSVPLQGPPPFRHPPPPGYLPIRTASAASVASWNTPHRERLNSGSSRASSLTAVINMYHRMPPVLRDAHDVPFAPLISQPRYYDYTEEFEQRDTHAVTSVKPLAPVPTRASSVQQPMVLREGSEEELAAALGIEPDSAFFDGDSQQDDSPATMDSKCVGDTLPDYEEADSQSNPALRMNASTIQRMPAMSLTRRLTRGSDVDRLPSQVGRACMGNMRSSSDMEPRVPSALSYSNLHGSISQANSPSPARQVKLHNGSAPTIRSEQGVIMTDPDEEEPSVHSDLVKNCLINEFEPAENQPELPSTENFQAADQQLNTDPFTPHSIEFIETPEILKQRDLLELSCNPDIRAMVKSLPTKGLCETHAYEPIKNFQGNYIDSPEFAKDTKIQQPRYSEHEEVTDLVSIVSNQQGGDYSRPSTHPELPTLISPQPISPARQLRVKESIPKLMKALPLLPRNSVYTSCLSSTSKKSDSEGPHEPNTVPESEFKDHLDDCCGQSHKNSLVEHLGSPLSTQKLMIRTREKVDTPTYSVALSSSESGPVYPVNHPWQPESPDIQSNVLHKAGRHFDSRIRKLRLRDPWKPVMEGSSGTVRRYAHPGSSPRISTIVPDYQKNVSIFSDGLNTVLRRVSRKVSDKSTDNIRSNDHPIRVNDATSENETDHGRQLQHLLVPGEKRIDGRRLVQRPRLRKRLSNVGWLLNRSTQLKKDSASAKDVEFGNKMEQLGITKACSLDEVNSENNNLTIGSGNQMDRQERTHFRYRMRARISRWVRKTRVATKHPRTRQPSLGTA
ncbi:hypothetical protein BX600DRAFT_534851 [Xylariales sp. PMI_506]|nr:hypothetical protein BX600DRAFT_534851 [Xylariales sp. PMI_506]